MPFAQVKIYSTQPSAIRTLSGVGLKRFMDIALILLIAPLVLPILVIIVCVLVLRDGQVFYSQTRVGQDGVLFRLWKFRSMVRDAENLLVDHLSQHPDAAREWRDTQKLHNDPRVTKFGRFLRKSSLDELPQLWNVLRGEMSLVGPRPVPQGELAGKYRGFAPAYLQCRPGLTGLWQVSGRNRLCYSERVQLDVAYSTRQSLALDMHILWRTIGVVLRGTGC